MLASSIPNVVYVFVCAFHCFGLLAACPTHLHFCSSVSAWEKFTQLLWCFYERIQSISTGLVSELIAVLFNRSPTNFSSYFLLSVIAHPTVYVLKNCTLFKLWFQNKHNLARVQNSEVNYERAFSVKEAIWSSICSGKSRGVLYCMHVSLNHSCCFLPPFF